jgi:high-affinity Fe2+/Pb2+ permease
VFVKRKAAMTNFSSIAIALAMIAAFLLVIGGVKLATDRQTRMRGVLMIVAALVLVMNVMIWTV